MTHEEPTITVYEGAHLAMCAPDNQSPASMVSIMGHVEEHGAEVCRYAVHWESDDAPVLLDFILRLDPHAEETGATVFCLRTTRRAAGLMAWFVEAADLDTAPTGMPSLSRAEALQHPDRARLLRYWDAICDQDSRVHGVIEATRPKQRRD